MNYRQSNLGLRCIPSDPARDIWILIQGERSVKFYGFCIRLSPRTALSTSPYMPSVHVLSIHVLMFFTWTSSSIFDTVFSKINRGLPLPFLLITFPFLLMAFFHHSFVWYVQTSWARSSSFSPWHPRHSVYLCTFYRSRKIFFLKKDKIKALPVATSESLNLNSHKST